MNIEGLTFEEAEALKKAVQGALGNAEDNNYRYWLDRRPDPGEYDLQVLRSLWVKMGQKPIAMSKIRRR